jgi:hypothetical protein
MGANKSSYHSSFKASFKGAVYIIEIAAYYGIPTV